MWQIQDLLSVMFYQLTKTTKLLLTEQSGVKAGVWGKRRTSIRASLSLWTVYYDANEAWTGQSIGSLPDISELLIHRRCADLVGWLVAEGSLSEEVCKRPDGV